MKEITATYLVEDGYAKEFESKLWNLAVARPTSISEHTVPIVTADASKTEAPEENQTYILAPELEQTAKQAFEEFKRMYQKIKEEEKQGFAGSAATPTQTIPLNKLEDVQARLLKAEVQVKDALVRIGEAEMQLKEKYGCLKYGCLAALDDIEAAKNLLAEVMSDAYPEIDEEDD